jgi:hypothetical protein
LQQEHPKVRHEVLSHAVIGVVQQNFQKSTRSSPRQVAPNGDSAGAAGSGEQVSVRSILPLGRTDPLLNRRPSSKGTLRNESGPVA